MIRHISSGFKQNYVFVYILDLILAGQTDGSMLDLLHSFFIDLNPKFKDIFSH